MDFNVLDEKGRECGFVDEITPTGRVEEEYCLVCWRTRDGVKFGRNMGTYVSNSLEELGIRSNALEYRERERVLKKYGVKTQAASVHGRIIKEMSQYCKSEKPQREFFALAALQKKLEKWIKTIVEEGLPNAEK